MTTKELGIADIGSCQALRIVDSNPPQAWSTSRPGDTHLTEDRILKAMLH